MKLYVVRQTYDKQAVGIFWATDLDDLIFAVDAVTETVFCEFHYVHNSGALVWEGRAPSLGTWRDFDTVVTEPTPEKEGLCSGDVEVNDLMAGLSPFGSLEGFFYSEEPDWEILIPGDYPRTPKAFSELLQRRQAEIAAAADKLPMPPGIAAERTPKTQPAPLAVTTNIYFIGCDDHVKIGMAQSVEKRFKALTTGHHRELTLLAVIRDAPGELEFELHQRFAAHRVRGEWFKLVPEIQAYIDEVKRK
jgi:hypothetical protein